MADEIRQQPVAIRVTRPYPTADEFLEHELETLTRTSITLLGAQPRPKGVILRFEVALTGGAQLLRGEGRVVGFKENALGDQPGLVLRFTRLDTKSKALVDRAAAIREARARAALQAAMGEDSLAPASIPPGSVPPHSIGPMSVMQEPPTRAAAPSMASSPPTRPAPITAPPAFFAQQQKQAAEAPAPPPAPSSGSFDDSTFSSAEDAPTAAETAMNPNLFDTGGSVAPPVPAAAAPSVPAPVPVASAPPPPAPSSSPAVRSAAPPAAASSSSSVLKGAPSRTEREPLLERLRDRAKNLSPERVGSLLRR